MALKRPLTPIPDEAPEPRGPALSKRTVARVASAVGVLGIIGTLVIFLLVRELTPAVFLSLIIGVIGLSVWLSLAPDDLRMLITRRQAIYGTNSLVVVALFAGIVALLYSFAYAANLTADLTAFRTYSLRPDVAALVQGMTKPAVITVFYNNQQLAKASQEQPILRMFADAAPTKIKLNIVDADAQPLTVQRFSATLAQNVFVSELLPDGTPETGAGKLIAVTNNVVGEQQIADALLLLQARGQFRALFTVGHGEPNTATEGGDISTVWNGLKAQGFAVGAIDIAAAEIPKDTSVLIMVGPKKDFTAVEVDRVARYLAGGGRALVLAEPNLFVNQNVANPPLDIEFLKDGSPFAAYLTETWGIKLDNDAVYDPDPAFFIDSQYLLRAQAASKHPIVFLDKAGTRTIAGLFTLARSLRLVNGDQTPDVLKAPLFRTSDKAYGATQLRLVAFAGDTYKRTDKDLPGPFALAYIAVNQKNSARLAIFGDSDWVHNDPIILGGNAALWSNVMDYLSDYTQKTSVSPTVKLPPMTVADGTLNTITVMTMVLLPSLILAAGIFVWWDRARR